jgi:hypothetical protein
MAGAAVPTSVAVEVERTGSPSGAMAVYRLVAKAGVNGAAFGFEYNLPSWRAPEILGSPLRITSVELSGSGTIRPARDLVLPKPRLNRENACRRERFSPFGLAYWVEVSAGAEVLIELEARGSFPRWPMTRYEVGFSMFELDEPSASRIPLGTLSVAPLSATGTHLQMNAVDAAYQTVNERRTPAIRGRTTPPLRNARISLRAVRPSLSGTLNLSQWTDSSPSTVVLGSVRTDQRGRFDFPSRKFPFAGPYAILARSEAGGGSVADWNCGPFF